MPMIDNPPVHVQEAGPSVQVNGIPLSLDYRVHVNGVTTPVYIMPTRYDVPYQKGQPMPVYGGQPWRQPMYFACADIPGPVPVSVDLAFLPASEIRSVSVHPLSRGIAVQREGTRVTFTVDQPGTLTLVVNGDHRTRPLHLFFSPPLEAPPSDAIVFGPGFHDLGYDKPITLTNNQTLYLAPGAWVEGLIRVHGARNIRIMGRGVLAQRRAGSADYAGGASAPAGIVLSDCQDISISEAIRERSEYMTDRLAISFWIWGIFNTKSNPYYDDLERRMVELKERGFNCIRLESGAGLCHDRNGRPRGELVFQEVMPGNHLGMFRGCPDRFMEGRCDPLKRLIELCTLAKRYEVKIILSSWYYLHTFWFTDEAINAELMGLPAAERFMYFARALDYLLTELEQRGLQDTIAFAEIFNEADGLDFVGYYGEKTQPKEQLNLWRSWHEDALEFVKARHPGTRFALDTYTPYVNPEHVPLVFGEGASYCAHAGMRWEERSDAYWEVVEHAARAYREHGLWGAVARTNSGPEDPCWHEFPDRLRRVNEVFLGEAKHA